MIRKTSIGIASVFLGALSLVNANDSHLDYEKTPTLTINTMTPMTSKPTDGVGFFVTGDALVWKANQEGLQFALQNTTESLPPAVGALYRPDFDFQAGFRFGLGYNTSYDNWDVYLNWTFFQPSSDKSLSSEGYKIVDLSSPATGGNYLSTFESATAHWRLHLNVLDLDLGRNFYVSPHLALRPHIGIRSAWIFQNQNVTYACDFIDTVKLTNNYWGIGIVAGLDSTWDLGMGFSVYGNIAASNISGFYNLALLEVQQGVTLNNITEKPHVSKAITDFQLGLRWEKLFDSAFLLFQVGWEQHIFYNQLQWQGGAFGPTPNGDLGISGVTIAARVGF